MAQLRKVVPAITKSDPICPNTIYLQRNRTTTFGRIVSPEVNIRLLSRATPLMISRKHATVANNDGSWTITDHQSLNGVFVNGNRIKANEPYTLTYGDKVAFGCPVGNNAPEFEYMFENGSNPGPSKRTLVESSEQRPDFKKRKLSIATSENRNVDNNYEKKIKCAEERVKMLQDQLKQKERVVSEAMQRMEEKEKDYRQQLLDQQHLLETEKKIVENDLKVLLAQSIEEKESLLKQEFEEQLSILKLERDKVECSLVEKFSRKLSEKEEAYQTELMEYKKMLDSAVLEKEEQQQKHVEAIKQEQEMTERLKRTEENEKMMALCLEKLRKDVEAKEVELQHQIDETRRVEQNAKKQVIETIEDEFTCIICQEFYIAPVTLTCAHSFCEYCLRSWVKKRQNCPVCRRKIKRKVVKSIVLNNAIEKFVETISQEAKEKRDALIKERQEAAQLQRTSAGEEWIFAADDDSDSGTDRERRHEHDLLITYDSSHSESGRTIQSSGAVPGPSVVHVSPVSSSRNPFYVSSPVRLGGQQSQITNLSSIPVHRMPYVPTVQSLHTRASMSPHEPTNLHQQRRPSHRSSDRPPVHRVRHAPVVCFNCGDTGHMSRVCPRR